MRQSRIDPILVIAGAHVNEIRGAYARATEFAVVFNSEYSEGQISSLKTGLRQIPAGALGVMVWPVDIPLVQPQTVRTLISEFERKHPPIVVPVFEGKHGHPVIYGPTAIQSALALKSNQTAKELRNIYKDEILYVDADDPAVLIDIDTPEDYGKYINS